MSSIKIKIIFLGAGKFGFDPARIIGWESKIFQVVEHTQLAQLPNMDGENWSYSKDVLKRLVQEEDAVDMVVAVTEFQIEDNYYCHRLGGKSCVVSWFGLEQILKEDGFSVEMFVIRNIYEMAALFIEGRRTLSWEVYAAVHDDTRGCLFDMNGWKPHVVRSMDQPIVCDACCARISGKEIPTDFLKTLKSELRKLQKPLYTRAIEFMKAHPCWAFAIATAWAVVIGVLVNGVYDLLKNCICS